MIEIRKPDYKGRLCQSCYSNIDVMELHVSNNGQGVLVPFCRECRAKLKAALEKDMRNGGIDGE